jgi:hypothetical protein
VTNDIHTANAPALSSVLLHPDNDPFPSIYFGLLTGEHPDPSWAIDQVEWLLRSAPPSRWREQGLAVVEAARANDAAAERQLAACLVEVYARTPRAKTPAKAPTPRRQQRKPSIRRQIEAAEKAGKTVTSVVATPDGTTLHFGQGEPTEASNPWPLDDFKVTKQ